MLTDLTREYKIYRLLKKFSRQRVGLVLNPGNVWVIEKAVEDTEENDRDLLTCLLRGWVEVHEDSIPTAQMPIDFIFSKNDLTKKSKPLYRLTDSGWSAIHRSHQLVFLGVCISILSLLASL